MSKTLVTGGAGFIGAHVVNRLLEVGHEVVALDDLSGGFRENVNEKAIFIEGSINDDKLINDIFLKYNFEYVYHLAAYAAEGLSHFIRKFNYNNNLIGSINLINASIKHKVKCFVFTSSIAVYGTQTLPMIESADPKPEDPYGVAKYAVELDLKAARSMFGLNYIIFRPHNVYGPLQNIGDRYRNVIGIFMNQFLYQLYKFIDLFFGCIKRGHPAHFRFFLIPRVEKEFLLQWLCYLTRNLGKNTIRFHRHGNFNFRYFRNFFFE